MVCSQFTFTRKCTRTNYINITHHLLVWDFQRTLVAGFVFVLNRRLNPCLNNVTVDGIFRAVGVGGWAANGTAKLAG